jgi:hypothetical protein
MRTVARILAGVVGLAAAATLFAQDPVGDLHDLIGVRGRHGDNQMRERGYTFVRTVENGANEFSYWRESRSGRCVSVRSAKNRYAAFSYVPNVECGGSAGQIGYGGGASGDSGSHGVTLHRDLKFTGVNEAFTSDVPDLRGSRIGDDHATSVTVSRGCRARLYQHLNYQGAYTEVTSSMTDLRGSRVGDDSATSLQVRCDGWGWNGDRGDAWGAVGSSASRGVTLYRDPKFAGISEAFASDVPDLRVSRIGDDQATSVSVSRGCQARLYPNLNYEGTYTEVSSSMTDLRGSKVGDDSATSLKVRCDR